MTNLSDILDRIQELVGAPSGGFYNITSRIKAVDRAHRSLMQETRALVRRGASAVQAGTATLQNLPRDFLMFAGSPITLFAGATIPGSEGYVSWGDQEVMWDANAVTWGEQLASRPSPTPLTVASSRDLLARSRTWDSDTRTGTPSHLVIRSPGVYELWPKPADGGAVEFAYVSQGTGPLAVDPMDQLDWVPFNSNTALNQFSDAIAYKVATDLLVPVNTELSAYVRQLYDKEVRRMRYTVRHDPTKDTHVSPFTGSPYAS